MQLWVDQYGCAGLTDNKGNQTLYILPEDRVSMQLDIQAIINETSANMRDIYDEKPIPKTNTAGRNRG